MAELDTNLGARPYFDDFDANNNFYRVLFRPGKPVQARELNQLQSILQDQIEKFGNHIFRDGSVIQGCAFTFDNNLDYVKISDNFANGTAFTIEDFEGLNAYGANGALVARIVKTRPGFRATAPDLNTLYVKYLNSTNTQSVFAANEELELRTTANVLVGNVFVSNVGNVTGKGYSFTTTEGVIFKKGFFIRVEPETVIVSPYNNVPNNVSIGFGATETIVTPEMDSSLKDNAAGSPNYAAPGAHRFKLSSTLQVRNTDEAENDDSFFSIVDFKNGLPVSIKNDPAYAALGADMARRHWETNGNFVIKPFLISTETKASNATHVNLIVSPGTGYVEGYRVDYLNNNIVDLRRGTDTVAVEDQIVTANFGTYVIASEMAGEFDTDQLDTVTLYDQPQLAVTNRTLLGTTLAGAAIGTARVRGVVYEGGIPGTPSARYVIYLFDVSMNPGYSFTSVRSISRGSLTGVADIVLTYDATLQANVAKLQEVEKSSLVFPFGRQAVVTDSFDDIGFKYQNKSSTTFAITGNASITVGTSVHGTGVEGFPYQGSLTNSQKSEFIVVAQDTKYSTKTGTVTVSTTSANVVGSGAAFISDYKPGDWIWVDGESRIVEEVYTNNRLKVDSVFGQNNSGLTHKKVFPVGVVIPFRGRADRTISISGNTATLELGDSLDASNTMAVSVYHPVARSETVPMGKIVNKTRYIKIDCSNNVAGFTGPWSLGIPDAYTLRAVYISNNGSYATSGTNHRSKFNLDTGQRDSHYGLARLEINPASVSLLNSSSTLTVVIDHFSYDTSQGAGFFLASSYPIDDANPSNTSAITTAEIPRYRTSLGALFDLRDSVDFRPFVANTANSATTIGDATINPSAAETFSFLISGSYLPVPDSEFTTDLSYYLGRNDRVCLDTSGKVVIIEGIPSLTPTTPLEKPGLMTLGTVFIRPFPTLTPTESKTYKRHDYTITTNISQNRRYTMRDIKGLDDRIGNLEYYTSLNLLEKASSDLLVRSGTTGQNRFKNGFLVDPFRGFDIIDVKHPRLAIAVDSTRTEARPRMNSQMRNWLYYDESASSGTVKKGPLVLLEHTSNNIYQSQQFASKFWNCIEGNIYTWRGTMTLDPAARVDPDISYNPDVVVNLDLAANWVALEEAWLTQYGSWNTTGTNVKTKAGDEKLVSTKTGLYGEKIDTYETTTTTTTTTKQERTGQDLAVDVDNNSYDMGTYVADVSVQPFVKSAPVKFSVKGMKPNTRVYPFFGDVGVSLWTRQNLGDVSKGFGEPLITDSRGRIEGVFLIPPNKFKSDEIIFKLCDVEDLSQGESAISTIAEQTYYATVISISKATTKLNTREAVVSISEIRETRKITDVSTNTVTRVVITQPPPATGTGGDDWPGGTSDGGDGTCGGGGGVGGGDCGDAY